MPPCFLIDGKTDSTTIYCQAAQPEKEETWLLAYSLGFTSVF
jgi:hypothetical protein